MPVIKRIARSNRCYRNRTFAALVCCRVERAALAKKWNKNIRGKWNESTPIWRRKPYRYRRFISPWTQANRAQATVGCVSFICTCLINFNGWTNNTIGSRRTHRTCSTEVAANDNRPRIAKVINCSPSLKPPSRYSSQWISYVTFYALYLPSKFVYHHQSTKKASQQNQIARW